MGGETSAHDEGPPSLHGVSIGQLAAVKAAVAEGFSLRAVLVVEHIDRRAFGEADLAWMDRLGRDAQLFETYRAELAAAEDWLTRPVSPLDTDLAAWVTFQTFFAGAPGDLLKVSGLGLNDVSRLSRAWSRRMEEDSGLQRRAARLGEAGPGELPHVRAEPPQLRRSRLASPAAPPEPRGAAPPEGAPAPTPPDSDDASLDLDRYASLQAELSVFKGDEARLFHKYGLDSEAERTAIGRRWRAQLDQDPALERDYRALYAYFVSVAENMRRAGRAAPVTTREAREAPMAAYVPPGARVTPAPSAPLPGFDAGGTTDVSTLLNRPALPFDGGGGPAPAALERALAHAARIQGAAPPAAPAGGTIDVAQILAGRSVPFTPPRPAMDAEGTMDVSAVLSSRAPLPFSTRSGAAHAVSEPPASPSSRPLPSTPAADGTMDVNAVLSSRAPIPFSTRSGAPSSRSGAPSPGSTHPPALAPPAAASAPPAAAYLALSMEQYASLEVELAFRPQQVAETLRRYGVAVEERASLDAHWRARFSAEPALFGAFSQACVTYRAWLVQSGR